MTEIIAILRGIKPEEALSIGEVLIDCGLRAIEVPMNSPDAMSSIHLMVQHFSGQALIGAGTVTQIQQVTSLAEVGGQLMVAPNCNPGVIQASKTAGLRAFPGVFTATECFAALEAGADGLKLFPASKLGLDGFQALQAVLPADTRCYAVGGVGADDFPAWRKAGIYGFGIGSALYKPGDRSDDVRHKANDLMAAWRDTQDW